MEEVWRVENEGQQLPLFFPGFRIHATQQHRTAHHNCTRCTLHAHHGVTALSGLAYRRPLWTFQLAPAYNIDFVLTYGVRG
jgi:hypothetical protein